MPSSEPVAGRSTISWSGSAEPFRLHCAGRSSMPWPGCMASGMVGDAHLSHIFVDQEEVSGFIDIDSIRRNRPPRLANLARDLGRLYHRGLPLGSTDDELLLQQYAARTGLKDVEAFERLAEGYASTRWKAAAPIRRRHDRP